MKAEIGIDPEGRAYIACYADNYTEQTIMKYMTSFLPMRAPDQGDTEFRIIGDRLPGSGKGG